MANENTQEQKRKPDTEQTADAHAALAGQTTPAELTSSSTSTKKSGVKRRNNRAQIGGTAVPGAKSTQIKPPAASGDPNQQQIESYNRTMRRRMEHIGAGPYGQEDRAQALQDQRQKKLNRRKQRLEEVRKSLPNGGKVTLGNKNMIFLISVAVLIILVILIFVALRLTHVLG